ncbi:hypothetical protein EJ03DRAFT_335091 [Teratosphaeria nubilosa]|uniref:F-box domain-containing protein n=1 Tax=Teratosphaeria nubilosa TaxID=161662 RepID=A0A6G1LDU4_9PEZI|nr:hypothetical protein EJ03DRAFT_335091 [Teratosphaeria nubilosa]
MKTTMQSLAIILLSAVAATAVPWDYTCEDTCYTIPNVYQGPTAEGYSGCARLARGLAVRAPPLGMYSLAEMEGATFTCFEWRLAQNALMELCAQDVNTPSETAHHKPGATHHEGSPFLALPPELRLVVYDIVLSDLVGDPLGPIYKLPAELPFNDITGFIRLSLVCRDIRHELRHHFEQTYLNKVMLYFHDPYELCRVFKLRSLLASEYGSLRFTFIRHSSAAIHSLQAETNPASSALFDDGIDLVYSIYARYNRPRLCQTHVHKFKHEFDASGLGRAGCPECPRSELRMCTTSDGIGPRIIHQQATCRKPEADRPTARDLGSAPKRDVPD